MPVHGPAAALLQWGVLAATALAVLACGEPRQPEAPDTTVRGDTAVSDAAPDRPIAMLPVRTRQAGDFPHEPHVEVACATCHVRVPGHDGHAAVRCAECHESPSPAARQEMTAGTCQACHHGETHGRACVDCHPVAPSGTLAIAVRMRVAGSEPVPGRTLDFEHTRHATVACADCHTGTGADAAPRPCTACHGDHHAPAARCLSCHAPPAPAHDLGAHRTCGGAGCHTDTVVLQVPQSRQLCLVCHAPQEDHEVGQECTKCHFFAEPSHAPRGAPGARE